MKKAPKSKTWLAKRPGANLKRLCSLVGEHSLFRRSDADQIELGDLENDGHVI